MQPYSHGSHLFKLQMCVGELMLSIFMFGLTCDLWWFSASLTTSAFVHRQMFDWKTSLHIIKWENESICVFCNLQHCFVPCMYRQLQRCIVSTTNQDRRLFVDLVWDIQRNVTWPRMCVFVSLNFTFRILTSNFVHAAESYNIQPSSWLLAPPLTGPEAENIRNTSILCCTNIAPCVSQYVKA